VLGNLALSWGMKHGSPLGSGVFDYIKAIFNPWVMAGIGLLILWMLSRIALLSWADLSYVLPVTSIGYVLAAVAGALFLGEHISPSRWIGTLFIMAGAILVGRTAARTTA
jgi:uncharacterized membrane protein